MDIIFHDKINNSIEIINNCKNFDLFKTNFLINQNLKEENVDFYKILNKIESLPNKKFFEVSDTFTKIILKEEIETLIDTTLLTETGVEYIGKVPQIILNPILDILVEKL